jgi:1-acyl-sn-glycerol-3-phosphate acyltransferase
MSRTALRSLAFNVALIGWTALLGVVGLPALVGERATRRLGWLWACGVLWLLRVLVGLDHELRGQRPAGPALYAVKHQSAWETIALHVLIPDCAFVLKRELLWIPVFGQYLHRTRMIAVDRKGGTRALRRLTDEAAARIAEGRSVVIFPEGTRTAPGETRPYHPGVAALYERLGVPVIPVALDSGRFWGRRSFVKRPGRIVVSFLDPIPPGLPRRDLMARLQAAIEAGCAAIGPGPVTSTAPARVGSGARGGSSAA